MFTIEEFEKFDYDEKLSKLEWLQYRIIMNSFLYYERNTNIIRDSEYDDEARLLEKIKVEYPEIYSKSRWDYALHNFNSSTGFDIWGSLTEEDKEFILKRSNLK